MGGRVLEITEARNPALNGSYYEVKNEAICPDKSYKPVGPMGLCLRPKINTKIKFERLDGAIAVLKLKLDTPDDSFIDDKSYTAALEITVDERGYCFSYAMIFSKAIFYSKQKSKQISWHGFEKGTTPLFSSTNGRFWHNGPENEFAPHPYATVLSNLPWYINFPWRHRGIDTNVLLDRSHLTLKTRLMWRGHENELL